MFKYAATILLLVAFITQTFRQAAIVGGYYIDNQQYAKNCINKSKPQLHCNGKCQMMKKLKQEQKKDQQTPDRKPEKSIDQYCSLKNITHTLFFEINGSKTHQPLTSSGTPVKMPRSLLRPPSC